MKILLVYPNYKETFWNFEKLLKLLGKRAAYPPLGLLTVASMMPKEWDKKLVDMNTDTLKAEHIKWADYIFISAMLVQKEETRKVIDLAKRAGKKVVAGGPLFTTGWEDFKDVDHIFLGEAEDIFPEFIDDLENNCLKKIYNNKFFPDIKKTATPDWDLVEFSKYNSMCIQFSRGCPFNCEFCDVVQLNGRIPRLKTADQVISELETLYQKGWRGGVFFVDDNLIGNKVKLKKDFLPAIIKWQKEKKYPFSFTTQVSINLADDRELIRLMANAYFTSVFIGIETPDIKSLKECGKDQNRNRNLIDSIKIIQNMGLTVSGGFIVGFDSDKPSIFSRQIEFIQKSGVVTAMVGLLNVIPRTRLYQRLKDTKRLLGKSDGNNTKASLNFIPKMDKDILINGYKKVLATIYSPKQYYERIKTLLKEYRPIYIKTPKLEPYHLKALFTSIWLLGIKQKGRRYYWNLIIWSLLKRPKLFPHAIGFSLMGVHFRELPC